MSFSVVIQDYITKLKADTKQLFDQWLKYSHACYSIFALIPSSNCLFFNFVIEN